MPLNTINADFNSDPIVITNDGVEIIALTIPFVDANTAYATVSVSARGLVNGDSAYWQTAGLLKSVQGTITAVGVTNVSHFFDSGASAWNVRFVIVGNGIQVRVTGSSSQKVGWYFTGEINGFTNTNFGGTV